MHSVSLVIITRIQEKFRMLQIQPLFLLLLFSWINSAFSPSWWLAVLLFICMKCYLSNSAVNMLHQLSLHSDCATFLHEWELPCYHHTESGWSRVQQNFSCSCYNGGGVTDPGDVSEVCRIQRQIMIMSHDTIHWCKIHRYNDGRPRHC